MQREKDAQHTRISDSQADHRNEGRDEGERHAEVAHERYERSNQQEEQVATQLVD